MRDRRIVCRDLVEQSEGNSPLGRTRRKWELNIKIHLQEVGWPGFWTGLIWLRIGAGVGHL
jgi:hypothetical protein